MRGLLVLGLSALLMACGGSGNTQALATPTPTAAPASELAVELAFPNLSNFQQPVDLQALPGGYLYLVEKRGRIWRLDINQPAQTAQLFLNIEDRVESAASEEGLLGLAFHPDFASNQRFFVYYSSVRSGLNPGRISVVAEYAANSLSQADADSEVRLMEIDQPFSNHNGGQLAFGPSDGYLYIALGDGGSGGDPQGHGQNTQTLLGSLLRIDVDRSELGSNYGIPPDNPFAPTDGLSRDEIYAWGLRNPFRFSFERLSNGGQRLWLGDVGQNSQEEINIIRLGGNYGWSVYEGEECFRPPCSPSGLQFPVHQYGRETGQSVIGGYVYRGARRPELRGQYLFTDFLSSRLFAMNTQSFAVQELLKLPFAPSSFGEDEHGELYMLDYLEGRIWRFVE